MRSYVESFPKPRPSSPQQPQSKSPQSTGTQEHAAPQSKEEQNQVNAEGELANSRTLKDPSDEEKEDKKEQAAEQEPVDAEEPMQE